MSAHLAQVCLFKNNGEKLRQFCDVVSGDVELDDGDAGGLLSYRMGAATVGAVGEGAVGIESMRGV